MISLACFHSVSSKDSLTYPVHTCQFFDSFPHVVEEHLSFLFLPFALGDVHERLQQHFLFVERNGDDRLENRNLLGVLGKQPRS